ncbi:MAG: transcriptional regulator [Gammaproteobacteria bacterium]
MDKSSAWQAAPFTLGEWRVDPRANCVSSSEQTRQIEPKTMAVLLTLVSASGRILTKSELLDGVWPRRYVVEGVLKRAVSQLRMALNDDARRPRYVQTVYKVGYRLLEPATRLPINSHGEIDVDAGGRIVTGNYEEITRALHGLDARTTSCARLTLLIGR